MLIFSPVCTSQHDLCSTCAWDDANLVGTLPYFAIPDASARSAEWSSMALTASNA